tara:strand:- start:140 stop:316 length:177 start_codon:yes stop_codon:yes gene_type:complete
MNQETKLNFALEHVAHLEDLFDGLTDDALLLSSLRDIKFILNRQMDREKQRKIRFSNV